MGYAVCISWEVPASLMQLTAVPEKNTIPGFPIMHIAPKVLAIGAYLDVSVVLGWCLGIVSFPVKFAKFSKSTFFYRIPSGTASARKSLYIFQKSCQYLNVHRCSESRAQSYYILCNISLSF